MVKLQKQTAYEYKGHPIYKYRINLPSNIVEKADWKDDQELEIVVKNDDVLLRPIDKK